MGGIFISYRRSDTMAWAGRLFADLRRGFGASQIFMDINGGIPRGANFEQVLTAALANCDTLLALIGPQWLTCKRPDGTRSLDIPSDWVRTEIATALGRKIPVIPVLFGSALLPEKASLPEDLQPLCYQQTADVSDSRWDYDVGELIKDLIKLTALKRLDDANTGIRLLKELITQTPAVADAVSRSKEVIENTYRQVAKLELFKKIHDAFHSIEFDCLRPMQEGGAATRLRPFKIAFDKQAQYIHEAIVKRDINPALRDDILDRLDSTAASFHDSVDAPGEAAYGRVVSELNGLLSGLPPRLDSGIADAAAELNLDRLVQIMTTVRGKLGESASAHDAELEPFVQGIDALNGLRNELGRRVSEHGQLQRLDSKLRTVCVGGILPGTLKSEWERIMLVRSRLTPPFSPELNAVNDDLTAIECDIGEQLFRGDEAAALDCIREYFRAASSVFRDSDRGLKDFCMQLSTVSQPLRTVLSMI